MSVDLDIDTVTKYLLDGQLGALVEQRSEVGPRALCHRSIVALPRPVQVRERLNQTKDRERWRSFGPVARAADAALWWVDQGDLGGYMVGAAAVTREGIEVVPATCHVDGTTRPQAIRDGRTPVAAALLAALERAGAPPVLVNTSFNRRGEPIVDSATDALSAFRGLDLDFLIMGSDLIVPLYRADHGRR